MTTTVSPDFPVPAGAHHVGDWCIDEGAARHFEGTMRGAIEVLDMQGRQYRADIHVDIQGEQYRDGTIDRYIAFYADDLFDAEAVRRVAADLLAAADEIEQLNEHDYDTGRGN